MRHAHHLVGRHGRVEKGADQVDRRTEPHLGKHTSQSLGMDDGQEAIPRADPCSLNALFWQGGSRFHVDTERLDHIDRPQFDETARAACRTTVRPQADATMAAPVLMFNVFKKSPPVPQLSIRGSTVST
jgi:hypothetical protein